MFGYRCVIPLFMMGAVAAGSLRAAAAQHPHASHPFGVADDIGIVQFGDVVESPRKDMLAVQTQWASLADGEIHSQVRIYSTLALKVFVNSAIESLPKPTWIFEAEGIPGSDGAALLSNITWLPNETAIAFLRRVGPSGQALCVAEIGRQHLTRLTPRGVNVASFSMHDESHFVVAVTSGEYEKKVKRESNESARVVTGRSFGEVVEPEKIGTTYLHRWELWAKDGGTIAPLIDGATRKRIIVYEDGRNSLSISPDGKSVITVVPLADVPSDWGDRYPAPFPTDPYQIKPGHQDLEIPYGGWNYVGEYVLLSLSSGRMTSLTNAPTALRAGWWEDQASPSWSDDGTKVFLPGTFRDQPSGKDVRPCDLVITIMSKTSECVRPMDRDLADGPEGGYAILKDATFETGRDDQIVLNSVPLGADDHGRVIRRYARDKSGQWSAEDVAARPTFDVRASVTASFKESPKLVAADSHTGRVRIVLDPNPQLELVSFGSPELYKWKNERGHTWNGILYRPLGYRYGEKYPLVIENHGFSVDRYLPSGGFPSAFVAQELASVGIMVLHVQDCDGRAMPVEGSCNAEEYAAAIEQLSKDGAVDPSRVGIIGFSRTVFYVLDALIANGSKFKAASITDGLTLGYTNYIRDVVPDGTFTKDQLAIIGKPPFGTGLHDWLEKSPVFNMDKVTTPLRVVARRDLFGVLNMWEPYALLYEMHKPVEFVVLNTDQHIIDDPKVRLAAQGGNVDWFRFWLQGYEDSDPTKKEQYRRWEHLRELRDADEKTATQVPIGSPRPN